MGDNSPSLEVGIVSLVQFNFINNQSQQKSEVGVIYFPF